MVRIKGHVAPGLNFYRKNKNNCVFGFASSLDGKIEPGLVLI